MDKVENDLFVSVDYKGTLQNGEVFDTSHGHQPLEIQMGAGQLIKGFEDALSGMALNEKKTFTLQPEEAYGSVIEGHVQTIALSEIPPEMDPKVGETVALTTPDGQQVPAQISELDDEKMTLDLNHPLAGEALTFEIEVVGISATQTQTGCGCSCDSGSEDGCSSGCC
jgi:peptidylprolyl isomerase